MHREGNEACFILATIETEISIFAEARSYGQTELLNLDVAPDPSITRHFVFRTRVQDLPENHGYVRVESSVWTGSRV